MYSELFSGDQLAWRPGYIVGVGATLPLEMTPAFPGGSRPSLNPICSTQRLPVIPNKLSLEFASANHFYVSETSEVLVKESELGETIPSFNGADEVTYADRPSSDEIVDSKVSDTAPISSLILNKARIFRTHAIAKKGKLHRYISFG